jgi:uncharacterized membrane protein YhiD involved in acid resistance
MSINLGNVTIVILSIIIIIIGLLIFSQLQFIISNLKSRDKQIEKLEQELRDKQIEKLEAGEIIKKTPGGIEYGEL